jgi:hypothetical protein
VIKVDVKSQSDKYLEMEGVALLAGSYLISQQEDSIYIQSISRRGQKNRPQNIFLQSHLERISGQFFSFPTIPLKIYLKTLLDWATGNWLFWKQ